MVIWHEVGLLALQVGTPLASVRVLTWIVALFGSERLSKRAMLLLRRRPPDHKHPVQDAEQAGVLPLFTPTARRALVTEVSYEEPGDSRPPGPETKDYPEARNGAPRATSATDLILEPTWQARKTVVEGLPADRDAEAA